jgi:predicted ArsR family transcriptional regulator
MDFPLPAQDALAQPTRAQIFTFLIEKRGPAGTEEVAEHFGLHPNGIRRHLERLLEGGFVTRSRIRAGQGRPRDSWAISPDAQPGGQRPRAYSDLAGWLARAIPANATRLREIERAGREIGRELAPSPSGDPARDLGDAFAALGFEPTLSEGEDGFSCFLGNCPYRDAVRENQPAVCTLHRGLTQGLLDRLGPDVHLADFVAKDPYAAGCVIELAAPGPEVFTAHRE